MAGNSPKTVAPRISSNPSDETNVPPVMPPVDSVTPSTPVVPPAQTPDPVAKPAGKGKGAKVAKKAEADPALKAILDQMAEDRKAFNDKIEAMEKKHSEQLSKLEGDMLKPLDGKERTVTAAQHSSKAERMRLNLASQPTVTIMIPLEGKEQAGVAVLPVQLNGYKLDIPKGRYVDVPKQIADLVKDSQQMTEDAGRTFRLDLMSPEKKEALV